MKKILLASAIFVFCAVLCAPVYAQPVDISQRWGIGVDVGGVFPSDDEMDNALYVGGNIAYGFNNYIALGAEAGWYNSDYEDAGVEQGDMTVIPIMGDIIARYPIEITEWGGTFAPYAIVGLGVNIPSFDEGSALAGVTVDMDPEFVAKLGGGFDYFFNENVALNLEGNYQWCEYDAEISTGTTEEIDGDVWMVKGGLKYFF